MNENVEGAGSVDAIQAAGRMASMAVGDVSAGPRLGQLLAALQQDFGQFSSPRELGMMLTAVQQLAEAGLPAKDVADAMFANPMTVDALKDGNTARASEMVAAWLMQNLNDLKDAGIPENRLQMLSQLGFAVGELVEGMRGVPGLREELLSSDFSRPREQAAALHQYLRDEGRATHRDETLWQQMLAHMPAHPPHLGRIGWFETYMARIRNAQRSLGRRRGDAEELAGTLPVNLPAPPVEQSNSGIYGWVVGTMMVIAVFLMFSSHC